MQKRLIAAVALLVLVAMLAGCAGSGTTATTAPANTTAASAKTNPPAATAVATAPPVAEVEKSGADAYDGPDAKIVTPAGQYPHCHREGYPERGHAAERQDFRL